MTKYNDQERALFEAWRLDKFCGGTERLKKCSNAPDVYYYTAEQEAWEVWQARAQLPNAGGAMPEFLPCDVRLPPATTIKAGCSLSTLLSSLKLREDFAGHQRDFAAAPHPVGGEQKPVGEIVIFGSDLKEVSWSGGKMPAPGTKLYAAPPAAQDVSGLVEALEQFADEDNWCSDTCNISREIAAYALAAHRAQAQGGDE